MSSTQKVLIHLFEHGLINTKEAQEQYNIRNLKDVINKLRNYDYRILAIEEPNNTNYILSSAPISFDNKYQRLKEKIDRNYKNIMRLYNY